MPLEPRQVPGSADSREAMRSHVKGRRPLAAPLLQPQVTCADVPVRARQPALLELCRAVEVLGIAKLGEARSLCGRHWEAESKSCHDHSVFTQRGAGAA